jgi:hypothetical protein
MSPRDRGRPWETGVLRALLLLYILLAIVIAGINFGWAPSAPEDTRAVILSVYLVFLETFETYKYLITELLLAMFFWIALVGRGYFYYCPLGTVLGWVGRAAGRPKSLTFRGKWDVVREKGGANAFWIDRIRGVGPAPRRSHCRG